MTSYTQPDFNHFNQNVINKDISVNLCQKCLIFYSKILLEVFRNMGLTIFVTMATYWVPGLHDIKGFSDHFKRSTLIFPNDPSSA